MSTGTIAVTLQNDTCTSRGMVAVPLSFVVLTRARGDAQWQVLAEFPADSDEGAAFAAAVAAFEAAYGSFSSGVREYKMGRSTTLGYEVRP